MSRVQLKQIIGRQPEAMALLTAVGAARGGSLFIEDAEGRVLHGAPRPHGGERFPVLHGEARIGWVSGSEQAATVARLLNHLVTNEAERKALGAEVLHLYREINLIYSFSEKLAALLDVERVARLTLQEARHLIVATDGMVLLLDAGAQLLSRVACFGDEMTALPEDRVGEGIVGAVAANGVSEIVNDVELDGRRVVRDTALRAFIAAPLKVGERVIGVLALGSTVAMAYTAAELKLLTTLALQAATAIENARLFERTMEAARERERLLALHKEAEIARAKLESELDLAARIQADLFPAVLPRVPGYEIAARNRPARRCGGDYYDALPITSRGSDEHLLFCVADVAGKGLPAALVMSNMQATLRALLARTGSLTALAAEASRLLLASTPPEKYVTAALVELVPATGQLTFVGAGHLDNVLLRKNGDAVLLTSTGPPLGLLTIGPPFLETSAALDDGDTLLLFSDGVTEAQSAGGEEFGQERLIEVLRASAGAPLSALVDAVSEAIDRFAGGVPQFDDITMLVVRRTDALSLGS